MVEVETLAGAPGSGKVVSRHSVAMQGIAAQVNARDASPNRSRWLKARPPYARTPE